MQAFMEFLFKYRLLLFQEGDFAFASPWPTMVVLGVVAALAVPAILTYGAARGDTQPLDKFPKLYLVLAKPGSAFKRLIVTKKRENDVRPDLFQVGVQRCEVLAAWKIVNTVAGKAHVSKV